MLCIPKFLKEGKEKMKVYCLMVRMKKLIVSVISINVRDEIQAS